MPKDYQSGNRWWTFCPGQRERFLEKRFSGQTSLRSQQWSAISSGPDQGKQSKENRATGLEGELSSCNPSCANEEG